MRNLQTFIAHILWDEEEPDILRGSLRRVTENEVVNFSSQQELIHGYQSGTSGYSGLPTLQGPC